MRIAIALCLVLLSGCSEKLSVEQRIILNLEEMEVAAEAGKHLDFMSYVERGFSAQHGSMDRRGFHRFMIFQINQNRRLHAQFFPIYVQETGPDTAAAQFKLLVTGGAGLLPERGQLFDVETQWQVDGADWLLSTAQWKPVDFSELPGLSD